MEKNKKAYTVFAWAALCLLAFTFIFPLYWIVTGSFKLQTAMVPCGAHGGKLCQAV